MHRRISVVICTYDRATSLRRTLTALRYLRHPDFEVVVVDGPSTDGTEAVLTEFADHIRTGRCPLANLAASRNVGIALAEGELVAFLDDDAVPEPDWLCELERPFSDPEVAIAGGFVRDHTGVAYQSRWLVTDRAGASVAPPSLRGIHCGIGPGVERFLRPPGTNVAFRRDVLRAVGGFDEVYAYYLDETDVILRVVEGGGRVRFAPSAEVHHKYAASHLRTDEGVWTSVAPAARSQAYFELVHSRPRAGASLPFERVAAYRREKRSDAHWMREQGIVDRATGARLLHEVDAGIAAGVTDAFRASPRRSASSWGPPEPARFRRCVPLRRRADRLRVALVSADFAPSASGGIGTWTGTLAASLAADGHEVTVVARAADRATVEFEHGAWVHRVPARPQPGRRVPVLPDLPDGVRAWALAAHDEVCRVHSRRGLDVVSAPIWDVQGAACLAADVLPVVVSLHSTYGLLRPTHPEWRDDRGWERDVARMMAAEAWVLGRAQLVLANSSAVVDDLERANGLTIDRDRLVVAPHGTAAGRAVRRRARDGSVRLLFVGRGELRKGADVLLAVLPDLLRACPTLEAVLAGDFEPAPGSGPSFRDRFQRAHAGAPWLDRVRFRGFLPADALEQEYADADLLVAPSRYESFGLVFLEAMRYGVACVGTRIGGIPEIITDGLDGVLVPPDDAPALADALARLLGDAAARARLGEAGRATWQRQFSATRMARDVAAALRPLVVRRRMPFIAPQPCGIPALAPAPLVRVAKHAG